MTRTFPTKDENSGIVSTWHDGMTWVAMQTDLVELMLSGRIIRLEPVRRGHIAALAGASSADRSLYRWSPVPKGLDEATQYVDTALSRRDAGNSHLQYEVC